MNRIKIFILTCALFVQLFSFSVGLSQQGTATPAHLSAKATSPAGGGYAPDLSTLIPATTLSANAARDGLIQPSGAPSEAQSTQEAPPPLIERIALAYNINPLTGLTVADPRTLDYPPALIPIARFPSKLRPSAGISQAAWVFEMSAGGEESRPMALFYGAIPASASENAPYIGPISAAIFGLEQIRKQYRAVLITAGNPKLVADAGLTNLENWFGASGNDIFPSLPVERYRNILERWEKAVSPVDKNGIAMPFSSQVPADGETANSVYVRYAMSNQILWRYDGVSGTYLRSQNSFENQALHADTDALNGKQVSVQNLILLPAVHTPIMEIDPNLGYYFDVQINFTDKLPAIIFRDGKKFHVYWTTKSEAYEKETQMMRPIRFIYEDGSPFPLKPGQSWVHVMTMGTPLYEVSSETGNEVTHGSGFWKSVYISMKKSESATALMENAELNALLDKDTLAEIK